MSNRLATQQSAYLLQHAEQPVDWYPWGEDALALAKRLDKPILLSIGYAACHWCHVMAHESFADANAMLDAPVRTQGREGRFYTWESGPLRLALSPPEWDVCAATVRSAPCQLYPLTASFREPFQSTPRMTELSPARLMQPLACPAPP